MNSSIFFNTFKYFQNSLTFLKIPFSKKSKSITVKILIQSPKKFLSMIWNFGTKTYPKFVKFRSFFLNSKIFSRM